MANKKYTREAILSSDEFKKYQKDFLAALLTKKTYTIPEALKIAEGFFKEEE